MKKVTAVFDIGKTNKKFFLFDTNFKEVHKEYIAFDEIEDEDGHPTENLPALQKWLKDVFNRILEAKAFEVKAIKEALGNNSIARIYVDGGFSNNDIYIKLLSHHFKDKKLSTTDASLGSALGAAISISDNKLNSKFLKQNYALKKHVPFILK